MDDTPKNTREELQAKLDRLEMRAMGLENTLALSFEAVGELQEREEQYRLLVESLPDVAWTIDSEGHTIYISPQVEEVYGFTPAEILTAGDALWFDRIHPDDRERVRQEYGHLVAQGSVLDLEYRIRHKNGDWLWLHDRAFTRSTKEGKRFAHGVFRDISAHKRADESLRRSEEKYRELFDNAVDAIFIVDQDYRYVDVNKQAVKLLGYAKEELLAMRIFDVIPLDQVPRSEEELRTLKARGRYEKFQGRIRRKDGMWLDIEVSSSAIMENGMVVGSRDIVRDITERKLAEDKLLASEQTLRQLIDSAPFGAHLYELKDDGRLVFIGANRAANRILGVDNDQFIGKSIEEAFPELNKSDMPARYRAVAERGESFAREDVVYRDEKISGAYEVIAAQLGKNRMAAFFRDITERKQAEDALFKEKNKSEAILAAMGDGISIQDRNYRVLYQNEAHKALIGEHGGEYCFAAYEQRGSVCDPCPVALAFQDGKVHMVERTAPTDEGTTMFVEITASPLRDADGAIIAGIEVVRNVTPRKRAEEDRLRSQEQAQLLIDQMPVGCIMWDPGVHVALWNPMAEKIFGYSALEALGKSAYDLIVPKDAQAAASEIWARLLAGDQTAHGMNENVTRDGRKILCEWYNTPIRDATGRVSMVLSMVIDITDRQRAEDERRKLTAQLLQSQKMEAVGLLAGGVAHDFNNILSAILGYASLLQMKMRPDDPLRPNVDQVLAASQRAATLTQSLLAFSRKQIINPQPMLVNEGLRKIERFLRRIIGEDIEFVTCYIAEDMTILADAGQLEQVIINLATNARDAMPQGGTLSIKTIRFEMGEAFISQHGYGAIGTYALIMVSDTGTGMDEKTRSHVFEPFFTTKELGKGTGLGLSMVYGTVKQNNGYVTCESEPGRGATFGLYLPIIEERGRKAPAAEPAVAGRGTETVLIAEDDSTMRDLLRAVFEEQGYTVIVAADGDEAVAKFRERSDEVGILVIDVVMPKKNGKEVFDEAQRIRPGIKALFTSGYTSDIVSRKGILQEGLHFISKPVAPADILNKVRQILDGG